MTTQHTQGPWKFLPETAEHLASVYAPHKINGATHIADVRNEANARLIAAAPELLELLIALEDDVRDGTFDKNNNRSEYLDLIQKIIAKALGES